MKIFHGLFIFEEFDLKIGDEVTIGWQGQKGTYLITGTVQFLNDVGRCFLISYSAVEKIGYDRSLWGSYSLKNGDDAGVNKKSSTRSTKNSAI